MHRFSVSYHKKLRWKKSHESIFLKIKGVGPKTVKKIWRTYNTVEEISKLLPEDFSKELGVSRKLSHLIIQKTKDLFS